MSALAASLLPIEAMAAGGGPTQVSPASSTAWAKGGVLRQEPVAGVHRVGPCRQRRRNDQVAPQVGLGRGAAGQPHRRVRLVHERRCGVSV
jgi:hypothetical protein